jgi:hypothetical protein
MLTLVLIGAGDCDVVVGAVVVAFGAVLGDTGAVAVGEPVGAVAVKDPVGTVAESLGATTVMPDPPVVGAPDAGALSTGADPVTVATTVVVRRVAVVGEQAVNAKPVAVRRTSRVRGWIRRMSPP